MSAATKAILTNKEIIAIDQDALGLQGVEVRESGDQSVWAKPLNANGARAVVLLNAGAAPADISVSFAEIGLAGGSATVRDLQAQTDLGTFTGQLHGHRARVARHRDAQDRRRRSRRARRAPAPT